MFSIRIIRCFVNNKTLLMCRSVNSQINNKLIISRSLNYNKSVIITNTSRQQINNNNNNNNNNSNNYNNNENQISIIDENLNNYEFNDKEIDKLLDFKPIDPLAEEIDNEYLDELSPPLNKSFNLSAFANRSQTIQFLIKLGVDLSVIENKSLETAHFLLTLDFEQDIKPYIVWLVDNGLNSSDLGFFITKNPLIFKEHFDDLKVRINYLTAKRFTKEMIACIITKAPKFLSYETKFIDSKLGFLQKEYQLSGDEVRLVVVRYPRIALLHEMHLRESSFMFKEEFGFQLQEIKQMLLRSPIIWKKAANKRGHEMFVQVFDLVHNEMKIPHELIAKHPLVFIRRPLLLKPRHLYLKALGRDQYDPKLPLYVPLFAFYGIPDDQFCDKYARTTVSDFNLFCKTL